MIDEKYLSDWSGTRYGTPSGLEQPADTAHVSRVLQRCNDLRHPIAVQGGRTGVSGGAAPGDGELVLSLERLNQIEEFDRNSGLVIVGAGVILEDLQRAVEADGWSFPIDLASRGSCQVGGNVATNAGGSRVLKYGCVRESVLGLEAVLADGTIIGPPNRLVKNNAGYSLSSLMVGSEGTLGVVTKVALRLVRLVSARRTALIALATDTTIDALLSRIRRGLSDSLSAFEVMWPDYVQGAIRSRGMTRELPSSFQEARVVLIEVEGDTDYALGELLESCLSACVEDELILDVIMSASSRDAMSLWAIREALPEIQSHIRPYVGFDLGIPAGEHDAFVVAAKKLLHERAPAMKSYFFGHAGDDNLHAVVGPCPSPEERMWVETTLFNLLVPGRFSVTAEHGIGRKKKVYLPKSRSLGDITAMRAIKNSLDPHWILNPGRIFDDVVSARS